jgi:hypothetical protein
MPRELLLLAGSIAGLVALLGVVALFALALSTARERNRLKRLMLVGWRRENLSEALHREEKEPAADAVVVHPDMAEARERL